MPAINKSFSVQLRKSEKPGRWTYVIWRESVRFFGTRWLVKVRGTVDGIPLRSAFMALGNGRHKLPVRAAILDQIGKRPGQTVKVVLEERL